MLGDSPGDLWGRQSYPGLIQSWLPLRIQCTVRGPEASGACPVGAAPTDVCREEEIQENPCGLLAGNTQVWPWLSDPVPLFDNKYHIF